MSVDNSSYITVWSKEGNLRQLEHAGKAIDQSPESGLAFGGNDYVVFATNAKKCPKEVQHQAAHNVFQIPLLENTMCLCVGYPSDVDYAIQRLKHYAFDHVNKYSPCRHLVEPPVKYLAQEMASFFQLFTQYIGARPLACEMLIAGRGDEGEPPVVTYYVSNTGTFVRVRSKAIGKKKAQVDNDLSKGKDKFQDDEKNGTAQAVHILASATGQEYRAHALEIYVLKAAGPVKKLTEQEAEEVLQHVADNSEDFPPK